MVVDAAELVTLAGAFAGLDDDAPDNVVDEDAEDADDTEEAEEAEEAEEVDTCVLVYAWPMIVKVYGSPENDMVS